MSEKTLQMYIDEAMQMYKRATAARPEYLPVSAAAAPAPAVLQQETGNMLVNVTTVRSLYPIRNARVTVFRGTPENMTVVDEGVTDESGKTRLFVLSAPKKELSEQPETGELPYAQYNILTEADGYVKQYNLNIPVFAQVTSVQRVNLIPSSAAGDRLSPRIIDEAKPYEL